MELFFLDNIARQLYLLNEGAMAVRAAKYPDHDPKKPLVLTVEESASTLAKIKFRKPS